MLRRLLLQCLSGRLVAPGYQVSKAKLEGGGTGFRGCRNVPPPVSPHCKRGSSPHQRSDFHRGNDAGYQPSGLHQLPCAPCPRAAKPQGPRPSVPASECFPLQCDGTGFPRCFSSGCYDRHFRLSSWSVSGHRRSRECPGAPRLAVSGYTLRIMPRKEVMAR